MWFFLILIAIAIVRFYHWPMDDPDLRKLNGQKIESDAIIIDEPESRKDSQRLIVKLLDMGDCSPVQLNLKNAPALFYGDRIHVVGTVSNIRATNEGYADYLRVRKIFYEIKYPTAVKTGHEPPSRFYEFLLKIKSAFVANINKSLPEPHSFLAGGLVITGKGSLDAELQEEFKRVGLIHIVVLSGFNVSIIAIAVMAMLGFLSPVLRFLIGSFCMICFALIVGIGASVVRSVIMTIISLYGKIIGRSYDPMRGLFVAGLFMTVLNPMLPFFDASFQMSFMATFGLIFFSEKVSDRLQCLTDKFGVREIISSTFATQITVTPLIMHLSGMISLISPISNILILPFIPYTMLFVTLTAFSSFISGALATAPSFISYVLLSYELWITHNLSALSFSAIQFEKWSWPQTLIAYLVISLAYIFYKLLRAMSKRKSIDFIKVDQYVNKHEIKYDAYTKLHKDDNVINRVTSF